MTDDASSRESRGPGLAEIARRLTTPALSGMVLTKQRITQISAQQQLPTGFGERSQMLMQLFRAGAQLERLPDVLRALQAEADSWERLYARWSTEYPASAQIWHGWQQRLAATRLLLAEMSQAAAGLERVEAPNPGVTPPIEADAPGEYED